MSNEELMRIGEREFSILDKCSAAPEKRSVKKIRSVRDLATISVDLIGHHGESLWETQFTVYSDNNAGLRADSLASFLQQKYGCPVETV